MAVGASAGLSKPNTPPGFREYRPAATATAAAATPPTTTTTTTAAAAAHAQPPASTDVRSHRKVAAEDVVTEAEKKLQAPQGRGRRALFKYYGRDGLRRAEYGDVPPEFMQLASKVVKRGEQHLANAAAHEVAEWEALFRPFEGMAAYVRALVALFECNRKVAHLCIGSLTVEGVERAIKLRHRKMILANTMVRNEL